MDRDAIRRLMDLEKENARLKRLVARMRALAIEHPRRGRKYIMDLLHKEGWSIGTAENGIVRRRATMKNEVWGMDFVQDRTADERPLRLLVVLDEHTR